ncbi:MAG: aminotransferase class I/II-fold pyridoxal phosphate-dependent enzyme [Deltaproteobacteria bacterium]|nr:aminotransferase class I/II-fold pyridoxal phosphate-dependent enzyme [Deltaproteobacteria bacterium]
MSALAASCKAVNPRTRLVVINNPQNPCGKVWSRNDLAFIAGLCEKHDAYVLGEAIARLERWRG